LKKTRNCLFGHFIFPTVCFDHFSWPFMP
jgi:hypothetical protein